MVFQKNAHGLLASYQHEKIQIEAWGDNALRVRATQNPGFSGKNHALIPQPTSAKIQIADDYATIQNGKIRAYISASGWMEFYSCDRLILKEYTRSLAGANDHCVCMKVVPRTYKPVSGNDYRITQCFEADDDEKIFGMGQYQQPNLNVKGCVLELAQRNSQISIPFYLSSKGYGFLWNNAGIGEVMFGANYTKWQSSLSEELDYWITADDTPKQILANYTAVTGRAPAFPENALGLWQCKLRYRTQEEVLEVAREYHRRGLPLDVIIIDFFHWVRQGDWSFDPVYWPDPQAMMDELKTLGVRCMVSVWPTVDKKSKHFSEMLDKGLLIRTEHGCLQSLDYQGDTVYYDATNPDARAYLWDKIRKNYYKYGIDMFWLDEAEPEYAVYDFENYRYYSGSVLKNGNEYPKDHAMAFYDGMTSEKQRDIVNLIRCAWVGSQQYGAVVWSGDIRSTFQSLRDQLSAGLNIGIAGIPWWSSDTGGFGGDVTDSQFHELLVRWFQFSAFSPVLRMHGNRGPHTIAPLSDSDFGGGFTETGQPNELWSYGDEVYQILKKYLLIRETLKPYLQTVMQEASDNGSPVMRTMFYEFPSDPVCWDLDDQYMFGERFLVAPVLSYGQRERKVYLPAGKWKSFYDGTVFDGAQTVTVPAPLDTIPVFEKL